MSTDTNTAAGQATDTAKQDTLVVVTKPRNWKRTAMIAAASVAAVAGVGVAVFTLIKKPEAAAAAAEVIS